jgi:hypothetical protein
MGFLSRRPRLLSVAHAPDPGVHQSSATHAEHRPSGDSCGCQDRRSRLRSRAARRSPRCHPAGFEHSARRGGHSRAGQHKLRWATAPPNPTTGSRKPETGVRRMSAAADPGGGAALDRGTSVAPPPILPPPTDSREHSERPADPGQCARLRALSATQPTPDREIILLWAVAGVSTPDIVAILGVTPAAVRRAQSQALCALPAEATANGPLPATRQRVVLLPHVRNHPTTAAQKADR